jgi:hypothetical protein
MADEPLRKLAKEVEQNLSPETKTNLEEAHKAQKELDAATERQRRAQQAWDERPKSAEDLRYGEDELDMEVKERKEALDNARTNAAEKQKAVDRARQALSDGLTEAERAELQKLGAATSRAGSQAADAKSAEAQRIFEESQAAAAEGRKMFEKEHGRVVDDMEKPQKGPKRETWITYKGKEGSIVVVDETGKLTIIKFDRGDPESIKAAAKKLAAAREAGESVARLTNAFGAAMMLLFVYDAVQTMREMADKRLPCQMLSEFIDIVQRGTWGTIWAQLQEWERKLTGPYAVMGEFLNYLKNMAVASEIEEMRDAIGAAKRNELVRKMRAARNSVCAPPAPAPEKKRDGKAGRKAGRRLALAALGVALVGGAFVYFSGDRSEERAAAAPPWAKLAGTANCDCEHVSAGLLTGSYIEQCEAAESRIETAAAANSFELTVADGKLSGSGPFCDSIASGPAAWPLSGGSPTAPSASDQPPCRYVGGMVQWECP